MRGVADMVQSGLTAKSGVKKQLARRRWAQSGYRGGPGRGEAQMERSSQQGEVIKKAKEEKNGEAGLFTSQVPKSF